jgi:protocatechuate 3,4-dioxygenase beta subunit
LPTTQIYVDGDAGNERDFLWRRLGAAERDALTVAFRPAGEALQARLAIVVRA